MSRSCLFPIDGREFETPTGRVSTRVTNDPDAPPASGEFSDVAHFMLEFSNGKQLTLKLSHAALHLETPQYRDQAFQRVQHWLTYGGPSEIELYGS
jgi:hypothetical protein